MSNIMDEIAQFNDYLMDANDPLSILENTQLSAYTYGAMLNDLQDRYLQPGVEPEKAYSISRSLLEDTGEVIGLAIDGFEKGIEAAAKAYEESYPPTKCRLSGQTFGGSGIPLEAAPCGCATGCNFSILGLPGSSQGFNEQNFPWQTYSSVQELTQNLEDDLFLKLVRDDVTLKRGILGSVSVSDVVSKDLNKINQVSKYK